MKWRRLKLRRCQNKMAAVGTKWPPSSKQNGGETTQIVENAGEYVWSNFPALPLTVSLAFLETRESCVWKLLEVTFKETVKQKDLKDTSNLIMVWTIFSFGTVMICEHLYTYMILIPQKQYYRINY